MASWNPPTSPITLAAGTRTLVSSSSPVSTPRTPILRSTEPTSTPSHRRSTMKAVMASWLRAVTSSDVLANTVYQSACTTPEIQHLVPLITHSSPSRTALVRMPMTSLPACGSERQKAARLDPSAMGAM